jgi:predicted metalloprotease with PDZ domain
MPVSATVDKKADAKLGLSIKRSSVTGTTRIGKVTEGGLFASTGLKEGMKVVSINDTRVAGMELNDILDVLKGASGKVTIVADNDDESTPAAAVPSSGASTGSASQRPSFTQQASARSSTSLGAKE